MTDYSDRIKPNYSSITSYLESLQKGDYQIPTFQREVVWEANHVKLLWDSIHKFYPLGSILIWKTDTKLQNHKEVGGNPLPQDFKKSEYQYILDGQQRTTALLTSLYGGKIKDREDYDPTLYADLTVELQSSTDMESFQKRFLFWNEIDDRDGQLKANSGKKKNFEQGFIVPLRDIKTKYQEIDEKLDAAGHKYGGPLRTNLRTLKSVLDNYKVSFIELKGIQVSEVCQIFERINRAGKPLDIFDIVVAKTFRPSAPKNGDKGFYLRELFENFQDELTAKKSNYCNIDYWTLLQILAVLIRREIPDSGVSNITDRYLGEIQARHIEQIWWEAKKAILKMFDFLENVLYVKGPNLVPLRYFYMSIAAYFFKNQDPDYELLQKYFWFYSFHNDDLLTNTGQLWKHIDSLQNARVEGQTFQFDPFVVDREKLRGASYSSRGRLSRAILSLYANRNPRDWAFPHRPVLADVYYILTDKPNLHHIFPLDFVEKNPGTNKLDSNSLMNIAYLTQITNLEISNKNPITYLKNYFREDFEAVIKNHLVPSEIVAWAKQDVLPENALDTFIEQRIGIVVECLTSKLKGIEFKTIDTKGGGKTDGETMSKSQ